MLLVRILENLPPIAQPDGDYYLHKNDILYLNKTFAEILHKRGALSYINIEKRKHYKYYLNHTLWKKICDVAGCNEKSFQTVPADLARKVFHLRRIKQNTIYARHIIKSTRKILRRKGKHREWTGNLYHGRNIYSNYNPERGKNIGALLDSLIIQERPYEIIIVDSNSIDSTADIIRSYEKKKLRI